VIIGAPNSIAQSLSEAGKDLQKLTTADLTIVDEFHIRGRKATLELASQMKLHPESHLLDIGSGLGGPERTLVETTACPSRKGMPQSCLFRTSTSMRR
jgi:hypothetical protein